jgi:acyl transferase domain-containing protein
MRGNLLAPDSAGQLRAMRSAYAAAGWIPQDVDFIECHGAGTPVGDAVELSSLHRLWEQSGWAVGGCPLGSIKSMIGHLLTAAGAAGVIKTLMAMKHGILPPTLHFRQAASDSPLNGGPFRVQTETEPWVRRQHGQPRRAAVSAFGFGGINAHLLLEEWNGEGGGRSPEARRGKGEKKKPKHRDLPPSAFRSQSAPVAVIGMSVCFGRVDSLAAFREAVLKGNSLAGPRPEGRWKGCDAAVPHIADLQGCFLEEIALSRDEFHIPPKEIPDILPQHLLMLKVAADAMADAGLPLRVERPRMGALIGIAFDFEATNFHLRWYLERVFPQWRRNCFSHLPEKEASTWLWALKEACSPPLTASRTLGALGSMVASRIAREFRFGGPSFVVSAEEASGLRALEIGVRALQRGELDTALIGAVELCGDVRIAAMESTHSASVLPGGARPPGRRGPVTAPGDGAAALVLKRLDQAITEGDRIYAVVRGIGSASGGGMAAGAPSRDAYLRSLDQAGKEAGIIPSHAVLFDAHANSIETKDGPEWQALKAWSEQNGIELVPGSVETVIGRVGAASGLASVVKTALWAYHGSGLPAGLCDSDVAQRFDLPKHPPNAASISDQFPRCAVSAAMTSDGNCMHVVLEDYDQDPGGRPKNATVA